VKTIRYFLISILVFGLLSFKLTQPFWGHHEFNGVFYGMIAKNYLRYGIIKTRGAQVTNLYPTPREQWSFHANHPATYPLFLSLVFKFFGSHEYVSRLVSIFASIVGVLLLVKLVEEIFPSPYSWLGAIAILFSPLFLYYGSMPVFEALLFPVIVAGLYLYWTEKQAKRLYLLFLICLLACLIDWPGFWLPIWLAIYELVRQKRKRVILTLSGSIALALAIIVLYQLVSLGSLANILAVGSYRLGVTKQPYTLPGWFDLLLARTRAFLGLPIIASAGLGFFYTFFKQKKERFWFLLITLGLGLSHIFVFRNITWYHDYMLYHLLPFLGLAVGSFLQAFYSKTKSELVVVGVFLAIIVTTVFLRKPFFRALINLEPHRDCVQMGYQVKESSEAKTFRLNSEKAKECPPFIGFYGEKPFEVEVED
jgi:4-amino-4-deoxy-L-arabinose transferase-like glycosyltransferase